MLLKEQLPKPCVILKRCIINCITYGIVLLEKKCKQFIQAQPLTTSIFIVDVDNTIANTWPTFLQQWPNENERLKNIAPFKNMQQYLQQQVPPIAFVYLTARDIRFKNVTYNWLQQHQFLFNNAQLFLVNSPNEKLAFLKQACAISNKVMYIDDLSYHHETGNTKQYNTVIEAVKKLPLTYFDAAFIDTINTTT